MNFDFYIFQEINSFALKYLWLDALGIFFAKYFGYILVLFLLFLLVRNFKKYLPIVIQAFSAAVLARLAIVNLIRWILPRPRPFVENHINLILDWTNQAAFPSGHAAFYFALSAIIYFYNRKAGLFFLLASFLISISRVFVGLHWPSDIVSGAVVGIFSAWVIMKAFKKINIKNSAEGGT
ncbi:phosphatase PAP2 family protein [Patescibacteria group bacterium]